MNTIKSKMEMKKEMAMQMYICGNQTQKAIASIVGVTEKTIGKWIDNGGWKDLKNLTTVTRKQLLKDSYAQLAAVNERIRNNGNVPTKEQYDAKSIIGKEIDRLSDAPLAVYTDVFSDFIDFMLRNYPKDAQLFAKYSMEFIENKSSLS
jgi:transposase